MKAFLLLQSFLWASSLAVGQSGYKAVYTHAAYGEQITANFKINQAKRRGTPFDYNVVFNDSLAYAFYGKDPHKPNSGRSYGTRAKHHDNFYNRALATELGFMKHPNPRPLLVVRQPTYKNFVILQDSLMMDGFVCSKGYYLQRTDTVYATLMKEITAPFGPHGFSGLPGLPIELYYTATQNRYILRSLIKAEVRIEIPTLKTLSAEQFQEQYNK